MGLANELQAKFRRAVEAFQARDLAKAEKILEQIRRASPNIFDVAHFLGVIKLMQGRFSEAEPHLKAAVGLNGNSDEALSNYGYALKNLNRPQEALAYFTRALAVNPRNPLSYHNRGTILAESSKNYPEAIEQFDKAAFYNPNFADAYSSKGNCLEKLARFEDALVAYDKALSIKPDLDQAWLGRGNVFWNLERYDEASSAYEKALSIKPDLEHAWLGQGNVLWSLKRYDQALAAYDKALSIKPGLAEAWLGRGNVFRTLRRYEEAFGAYDKALSAKPDLANAWLGLGDALNDLRRCDEALAAYDKALAIEPDLGSAWVGRGHAFWSLKRFDEALAAYDRALSIEPDLEGVWLGRGNVFCDLLRYDDALAAYEKALSIRPDLAEAWLGRGNVFWSLKRYDEAFAAYDKALSIKPDLEGAWLGRANALCDLKRYDEAAAAYDRALSIRPDLAEARLGRGNVFTELKRHDAALAAYEEALSIKPDLAEAWLGRGNVLWSFKRYEDALAAYDKTLSIKPDLEGAWQGRGNVFSDLKRHDEAFAAYDKALSIKPDLEGMEGSRLHAKMNLCEWDGLQAEIDHLLEAIRAGKPNSSPFALLSLTDAPDDHLACARAWVAARHPQSSEAVPGRIIHTHDKIRIGYVSPDFRQHPVGYLTAGIFESHDPERFETYAFSIGPNDNSDMRKRLEGAFHRFIDCQGIGDGDVVAAIKGAEIDILVDLAGHTQNARLSLFASAPAPIAVNFLGFAGTVGSKQLSNYIIADHIVLPDQNSRFFEERIVRLPGSFMPRDDKVETIDDTLLDRADHDLRPEWIVFCCFNNAYKINPAVFDCWMSILGKVDQSVLWLSEMGETAKSNLRKEARGRGIDPDRLVFAKHVASSAEHLARHRLADLFLDALPYNAHTTASDALWAGLPVVTQIGDSFAGRVAASLLDAVGLPELITRTRDDYEALAVELALDRPKLQGIRQRLRDNRLTTSLFDVARYTRQLEAAYEAMHQRHLAGLPPDHIDVRPR